MYIFWGPLITICVWYVFVTLLLFLFRVFKQENNIKFRTKSLMLSILKSPWTGREGLRESLLSVNGLFPACIFHWKSPNLGYVNKSKVRFLGNKKRWHRSNKNKFSTSQIIQLFINLSLSWYDVTLHTDQNVTLIKQNAAL